MDGDRPREGNHPNIESCEKLNMPNFSLLACLEIFQKFVVSGWWVLESHFSVQLWPKLNNNFLRKKNSQISCKLGPRGDIDKLSPSPS